MIKVALYMHFFKDKKERKDKTVQGGDDDRELLSVSLTQSEQLYVCTIYQSISSFFRFFLFVLFVQRLFLPSFMCAVSCTLSHTYIHHELSTQLSLLYCICTKEQIR